jgi:uncharacterized membrane protein YkoI
MKIKTLLMLLFSVMLAFGLATVTNAQTNPDKREKPPVQEKDDDEEDENVSPEERKRVKISAEQARRIALERVSGTIIEEELEKENGRIVYSIEIRDANRKVYDVEVDAQTGAIVNVEEEDEDDDDDEKPQERKKKPSSQTLKS